MAKIFPYVAGNTLGCHEKFLGKLKKKGAKRVEKPEDSDVIIVFCPIVSRYMSDIRSALSSIPEPRHGKEVILVAMHHTFNEDYTLPNHREDGDMEVALHVDCLFYETKGLLSCPRNKSAVKKVREKLSKSSTKVKK